MSILTRITELTERIATEFNLLNAKRGNLESLNTTQKITLVAAINELEAAIASINILDVIDDSITTSETRTWSIDRLKYYINVITDQAQAEIRGGVDASRDTLKEISDAIDSLQLELNQKASYNETRTLSKAERSHFRSVIQVPSQSEFDALELLLTDLANEIGDTSNDFVSDFETELMS